MQEILLKIRHFVRELSKSLKKGNFFLFQTQSFLMDKVVKNKRGLELLTKHKYKTFFVVFHGLSFGEKIKI